MIRLSEKLGTKKVNKQAIRHSTKPTSTALLTTQRTPNFQIHNVRRSTSWATSRQEGSYHAPSQHAPSSQYARQISNTRYERPYFAYRISRISHHKCLS